MAWSSVTTPVSGTAVSSSTFGIAVAGDLNLIGGAWTAYTPVILAGATPITISNGTLDAAYKQVDKTVHWRVAYTVGSSDTLGSGAVNVALPVTAKAASQTCGAFITLSPVVMGVYRNTQFNAQPYLTGTTTIATIASLGLVTGTVFTISGTYEGA